MSILKFGSQKLGDELVSIRPAVERLVSNETPLLGSASAYVDHGSPNWLWRIRATVYASASDVHALNDYLVTLKQYFDTVHVQDLVVRNAADTETTATYPNCRLDGMSAPEPSQIPFGRYARIVLTFTSSSDPTKP